MRLAVALAIAATVVCPALAMAQANQLPEPTKVQCFIPGPPGSNKTFLDVGMTQGFHIDASKKDDAVMAAFTGTWYGEFPSPDGLYYDRTYYSFEPNGLFQYQSQTCSQISCSQNYGTGQWVGLKQDAGQIRVIFNWSDMVLTSGCSGMTGTLEGNVFRTSTGFTMQRAQPQQ